MRWEYDLQQYYSLKVRALFIDKHVYAYDFIVTLQAPWNMHFIS